MKHILVKAQLPFSRTCLKLCLHRYSSEIAKWQKKQKYVFFNLNDSESAGRAFMTPLQLAGSVCDTCVYMCSYAKSFSWFAVKKQGFRCNKLTSFWGHCQNRMGTKPIQVIYYPVIEVHTVTRETEQIAVKCYNDCDLQTCSMLHCKNTYTVYAYIPRNECDIYNLHCMHLKPFQYICNSIY